MDGPVLEPLHPVWHSEPFRGDGWVGMGLCKLHINGDQFFPEIFTCLRNARHRIWIEIYLVESGQLLHQMIDHLLYAAAQGIDVRLCFDSLGSLGFKVPDRKRLLHGGVRLAEYNPWSWMRPFKGLLRDHRKMIIVDEDWVFVGGAGFADDFAPELHHMHWRETMLQLSGPIVQEWSKLFLRTWPVAGQQPLSDNLSATYPSARVVASEVLHPLQVSRSLLTEMRHAQQRIWIATPYFLPPRRLRKGLKKAARRGVDVRLLIPGPHQDHPWLRLFSRSFYKGLIDHQVAIYEYQPRFIHMKVILCDQWVSIGSSNLDQWGMFWNQEANQEVRDATLALQVQQMLEQDFAAAKRIIKPENYTGIRLVGMILQRIIQIMEQRRNRINR